MSAIDRNGRGSFRAELAGLGNTISNLRGKGVRGSHLGAHIINGMTYNTEVKICCYVCVSAGCCKNCAS
jgi:hypothetical protein